MRMEEKQNCKTCNGTGLVGREFQITGEPDPSEPCPDCQVDKRPCFLYRQKAECFSDIGRGQEKLCQECFKLQDKITQKAVNDFREKKIEEIANIGKNHVYTAHSAGTIIAVKERVVEILRSKD